MLNKTTRRLAQCLAALTLLGWSEIHASDELVILNWADYLDETLIEAFEQQYNTKIRQVYFETDQDRDVLLAQYSRAGFDLAMVDAVTIEYYQRSGWLLPLSVEEVPNLQHINPDFWRHYPAIKGYAAPYAWGTMGIIYRSDLVEQPLTSWKQLLQPAPELSGKIIMIGDSFDLTAAANKALGHPMMTTDRRHLQEAEIFLRAQRPHVKRYGYVTLGEDSELISGEVVATQAYNGDYYAVQEYQPELVYVIPEEGGSVWLDSFVLFESSKNQQLAKKFIDFINEPENAAQNAESIYYATPNKAAKAHLSKAFLEDKVIHPSSEALANCERFQAVPAKVVGWYNTIYHSVIQSEE
ncbi:MAG: spermidine/putrescine ABC transporter substrate-binding protein [Candidatus Thiodiazotropha sp. (ex Epidulcina cf. delphinae)]|nr:spermidine/putrescine ABC transporter substrate-binding protein [Candidatus Thiodiazotropha sp. (ex Epidulcina cf. delphinae)]